MNIWLGPGGDTSVAIVAAAILIILLAAQELLAATGPSRITKNLTIGIVPLLAIFIASVVKRILEILEVGM